MCLSGSSLDTLKSKVACQHLSRSKIIKEHGKSDDKKCEKLWIIVKLILHSICVLNYAKVYVKHKTFMNNYSPQNMQIMNNGISTCKQNFFFEEVFTYAKCLKSMWMESLQKQSWKLYELLQKKASKEG